MGSPNSVTYDGDPRLEWDNDAEQWVVAAPFTATWTRPNHVWVITVASGFTTDLASIPHRLRSFIPQVGRHLQASILHDWCYEDNVPGMTRKEADLLFLDGMKASGVAWHDRWLMYLMVRLFGWTVWG